MTPTKSLVDDKSRLGQAPGAPALKLPLMTFDILWKARRCPRRLRAWMEHAALVDSRQITWSGLQSMARRIMGESDPDEGASELDCVFQELQELAAGEVSRSLMDQVPAIQGSTLWEEEGNTLHELGWQGAVGIGAKTGVINSDTWFHVLPGLSGLYRPVIKFRNLLARPDYLLKIASNDWILVFVRASTKIKDAVVSEAEYTRYVCAQAGLPVAQVWLLHTAEDYVRSEAERLQVEPRRFFALSPLGAMIKHLQYPLSVELPRMLERAMRNETCRMRDCRWCGHEIAGMSADSIHTLHRPGRAIQVLEAEGIHSLSEIDKASPVAMKELKDRHFVQLRAFREQKVQADIPELKAFLLSLEFPLSFLDFESTSEVVPPLCGARPWEHLPFLYSLHIQGTRGSLQEFGRVADPEAGLMEYSGMIDPVSDALESLESFGRELLGRIPPRGSILAYGAAFEVATLIRIGRICPTLSEGMQAVARRVVDLQVPFQNFWYYHPLQLGKLSLKKILPLLTSQSHESLAVRSGGEAHLRYYFWRRHVRDQQAGVSVDQGPLAGILPVDDPSLNLVSYCRMDTLGLVHIVHELVHLAGIK